MIYLISSLRHPRVREVAAALRARRLEVFDDWHAAGPEADDIWQCYEKERGRTFREALAGEHAQTAYKMDRTNIDRSSAVVLVMPAGKSGHIELGYGVGQGKPGYILLEKEPDRWDLMYAFATKIFYHIELLTEELAR
jgi:nucleoside 2-deoxyribosyltransferase